MTIEKTNSENPAANNVAPMEDAHSESTTTINKFSGPWEGREPVSREIDFEQLIIDPEYQLRHKYDQAAINEYARLFKDDTQVCPLPPGVVFEVDPGKYLLVDGFHRYSAAMDASRKKMTFQVYTGTRDEALLYAAGANRAHGVPRTADDIQQAVCRLLLHDEFKSWTDRRLSDVVGCCHKTVGRHRGKLEASGACPKAVERIGSDGRRIKVRQETSASESAAVAEPIIAQADAPNAPSTTAETASPELDTTKVATGLRKWTELDEALSDLGAFSEAALSSFDSTRREELAARLRKLADRCALPPGKDEKAVDAPPSTTNPTAPPPQTQPSKAKKSHARTNRKGVRHGG